jgi:Spy/CpxP family protein refolding chaperone
MKTTIIICSVILGTVLATPTFAQRGQGSTTHQEFMQWKMRKDLGLNDDQITKITTMREKHQEQALADRAALREDVQKRRDAMREKAELRRAELKTILTPEQYEKWQDIRFENYENRMQDRDLRQSNRPMRGSMQMRGNGPNRPGNRCGYRNAPPAPQRRG